MNYELSKPCDCRVFSRFLALNRKTKGFPPFEGMLPDLTECEMWNHAHSGCDAHSGLALLGIMMSQGGAALCPGLICAKPLGNWHQAADVKGLFADLTGEPPLNAST
ncbi:MAG: hypothetical protein R6U98_17340, partial [Pirellulaceae bacterium]